MFPPLLLLLIVIPLLEIYVLIQVGDVIGVPLTIVALLTVSILGAWLLKREGLATWRRVRETMARGAMPTAELTDGVMIIFGGALLLTPGFVTDIVGFLLILPPTRRPLKGAFRRLLGGWFLTRSGLAGNASRGAYAARVVRTRRTAPTPRSPVPPAPPESPERAGLARPDDEDGSPGTA